jgi:outer membrane receptor for ferrienterochelin and colicin
VQLPRYPAAADSGSDAIQELTVTAQRRTENMQDVPITIQAMTGETLKQLNVTTLDDGIKNLPNVTQQSNGLGQSNIFIPPLEKHSTLMLHGVLCKSAAKSPEKPSLW